MPAERITMRHAREIIRLKSTSVSAHEISRRLDMPRSTVRATIERAESAGLSWPLPEGMNVSGGAVPHRSAVDGGGWAVDV